MHRYFLDILPEYLLNMFSLNVHVHNYNTTHNQLLHQSKVTSHSVFKSIRFVGPIIWNTLSPLIRNTLFGNSKDKENLGLERVSCNIVRWTEKFFQ